jgi:RimJ/RimL family protein N-acetyltransferase
MCRRGGLELPGQPHRVLLCIAYDPGRRLRKLAAMGDLVTLRPVTEDDLSWLASLRSSPAAAGLHEWHGWTDPQRRRRQWAESGLLGDDGGTLIVLHDADRVGQVSWRKVTTGPTAFGWAIAVGLAPDFRGRGYGSEAQRLLARYLFAHTQVNRIEATTEITNVAEQRALEKAGFTREGILRGTTFRQGRWHDHVIYSVLRDEVNLMDASAGDGPG